MQVASEQMHLTLLPAARASYAQENAALTAASAQATGLPWIVVVLVLAIAVGFVLYRAQRWLSRRTHRVLNLGLLAASRGTRGVGAVADRLAFAVARTDLQRAVGHGSVPAEALAQAAIDTQQARGYEVLNLISRSGDATFVKDFQAVRARLGPGPGRCWPPPPARPSGAGARWAAAAARDVQAWYTVIGQAYALDSKAQYTTETALVIGPGAGRSTAGFARVEADLSRAIDADHAVFHSSATAGRNAFTGLDVVIIARRGADGRRVRLGPVPPARGVPMTTLLSREQAAAAVAAAVAERDTIQANLLELDNSFGKRLLAGAALTGGTRKRWDAAAADLTTLWETFDAYSAVVDRAAELMAGLRRSADRRARRNQFTALRNVGATQPPLAGPGPG